MSTAYEATRPTEPGAPDLTRRLDEVWAAEPFAEAAARTEHLCAVLPLLDLFEHDPYDCAAAVRAGQQRAALGLFTPNAPFAVTEPTLRARPVGAGLTALTGRFRYADGAAEITLATVWSEEDETLRLALLPHTLAGVRLFGAGRAADRGWGEATDAALDGRALSRPVSWRPDGPLVPVLDAYAWEFSRRSVTWSAKVVADLRRALANTGEGTGALSTSQYLAHELSRLEIELSLAAAAASFGAEFKGEPPGGESVGAVLAAGTELLWRTVRIAEDLSTELGLVPGPVAEEGWPADVVQASFGGRRMVEGELARRMGLVGRP
ncbi:hypothetical protein [Streptomyces profundus]|uniref:hypothetical protein n=1 Tax=Streptomyces profundus TaxID=2867410 RepID=UPI001D169612|nr:hypothetical protein [Streptomyces sp. MA3_2.13]UED83204.1 hypothetical protein K4G22_02485 [Streptomyces sp. MA3_2.13]